MLQFESRARYGDNPDGQPNYITVKADTFVELHRAIAALAELQRDADFLKAETGAAAAVPERHATDAGHEYLGFADPARPHVKVNFGASTDKAHPVPFFPKGPKGLYRGKEGNHEDADDPHSRPPASNVHRMKPATSSRPAIGPGAEHSPDQARALRAFEAQAQLTGLGGLGCSVLMAEFETAAGTPATRLGDLTAEQLGEMTETLQTTDDAARYNAHGFALKARGTIEAAPERQRARAAERAREAARAQVGPEHLGRVLATIDAAAGVAQAA